AVRWRGGRRKRKPADRRAGYGAISAPGAHGGSPAPLSNFLAAEAGTSKSWVASAWGTSTFTSWVKNRGWPTRFVGLVWPSKPSIRTTRAPPGVGAPLARVSKAPSLISAKPPWPEFFLAASGRKKILPAGTALPLKVTFPDRWY